MIGADIRIIYTPEDREAGQAELEMRTAEAEGRALDERWHVRKGGERFWADGLVMPLKDDVDRTRGFLKILRDMTGQRHPRGVAPPRTAALEQADRRKDEFLAMLAHELRNPLAAISNAVDRPQAVERRRGASRLGRTSSAAGEAPRPADRRPARRLADHQRQDPAPQGGHRRDARSSPGRRGRPAARSRSGSTSSSSPSTRPTSGSRPTRRGSSRSS